MDSVQVIDTDEDELVDIENDDVTIDNKISDTDVTIDMNNDECAVTIPKTAKRKSHITDEANKSTLFKRTKVLKKFFKENDSLSESDLTKWWKSASEFRRPSQNDNNSNRKDGDCGDEMTLNPLLRSSACTCDAFEPSFSVNSKSYDVYRDKNDEVFIPPTQERQLPLGVASDDERENFPDFFDGKTKYSPERYLVIRDSILKLWTEQKPCHVNKVMLRPILKKSCGNVNNIGRIHRYLESIGAINFGSDLVWWKQTKRKNQVNIQGTIIDTDDKLKRALDQRMRGRNTKTPDAAAIGDHRGEVVGGYTIHHDESNTE